MKIFVNQITRDLTLNFELGTAGRKDLFGQALNTLNWLQELQTE